MFCTRCGRQINAGAKFCPFCGQEVGAPVNAAVPKDAAVNKEAETVKGTGVDAPKRPVGKAIFGILTAIVLIVAVAAVVLCVKLFGADKQDIDSADKQDIDSVEEVQEEKSSDKESEESADMADDDENNVKEDPEQPAEEAVEDNDEEEMEDFGGIDDEKILEVLTVYQAYVDDHDDGGLDGFVLAYLDEDDIPELIAIGDCEAAGQIIITYHNGELRENYIGRLGGLSYVEKQNFYYNSNGHMGFYYDEFYRLEDGEQVLIAAGQYGDKYDEEGNLVWNEAEDYPQQEYSWNGVSCSEEEYYEEIEDFVKETVGDAEITSVDTYQGDLYFNMLDAYNGLKVKKYSAYWPQVAAFELEDDVLTFSVGGGARYGWGTDEIIYTVSYPVAEDCIWENRSVGTGQQGRQPQVGDTEYLQDTTYEEIKDWIDTEKRDFEEAVAAYGEDEVWVESPVNVVVVVEEGVVVRVYTVIS